VASNKIGIGRRVYQMDEVETLVMIAHGSYLRWKSPDLNLIRL
jgi:hypothetical protein